MKALILNGARNPKGQTATATAALAAGLTAGGAEVEEVFLPTLTLERCRQCEDNGWGICVTEGRCTIDDDFTDVAETLRSADLAVLATPVYYGDLSESLRAFTDRLRRTCFHEAGRPGIAAKPAVGVCVAGGGGGGSAHCCVSLERTLQHTGLDVIDLIPVRRQNLDVKREVLESTGRRLAEQEAQGESPV